MDKVFISSVQRGYGPVRIAVARAIESLGLRAVMAEHEPAAARSAKGALLEQARGADAMVLIIGARYGDAAPGETSPTEDEFNEAVAAGRPVLALVQNATRDPAQDEFLRRVRGSWAEGSLTAPFDDEADVELKAMQALSRLQRAAESAALRPVAEAKALELAERSRYPSGTFRNGSPVQIAVAPLIDSRLINDAALNQGELVERLIIAARKVGLIPQKLGVDSQVNGATGIALQAGAQHAEESVYVALDRQGALVVETSVAGSGMLGSMAIDPDRLARAIEQTGAFALSAWGLIDSSDRITQACVAVGIPGAQNRVYGRVLGSSVSLGSMRLPETVIAPRPPHLVRRADLGTARFVEALTSAVERVFRDVNAITGI